MTFRVSGITVASGGPTLLSVWEQAPESSTEVAFSPGDGPALAVWNVSLPADVAAADSLLGAAEARLARLARELAQSARQLASVDEASFDVPVGSGQNWPGRLAELQTTVARLQRGLVSDGLVETEVGAVLVARTQLSWLGDERTVWQAGCGPDHAELHRRTVDLAVASRLALLNALATTLRLGVTLSLPGGQMLAIASMVRLLRSLSS